MRTLFELLWRNHFVLLFVAIQSFCIYLIVQNNRYQHASFFNSSNAAVAKINEGVTYFKEYIHLRENNQLLANENAQLRNVISTITQPKDTSKPYIVDTLQKQQYTYITAKVVNSTSSLPNNYLTINKGTLDGIKPEMGVICGSGVVGIVQQVSEHYSTVMTLLHTKSSVSAKINANGFYGSLVWGEEGNPHESLLKDIDKTVPVKKGDTISTTEFSALFPAGIIIGKVIETKLNPGSNFNAIKVRLSTNFDNLSYVYVIDNLKKNEQRNLEESTQKANDK
ncbi:MAG: rod shape-determining protein MreC [Bacteroidota bacterium]